jgi:hypothetical protein
MLVKLFLGLITLGTLIFLVLTTIYINSTNLGTKFKVCIPYSDCNIGTCHKQIQTNTACSPPITCYKTISPSFKDVYQDVYEYYKQPNTSTNKDNNSRKHLNHIKLKYLININLLEILLIILIIIIVLVFLTIYKLEIISDFDDFDELIVPLLYIFYSLVIVLAVYCIKFKITKMHKIHNAKNNTKTIILKLDNQEQNPSKDENGITNTKKSNNYSEVYNNIYQHGLISMILVIVLCIFSGIAFHFRED